MNYHLDPNTAYELYQNVGLEFANNIIDPAFADFIKEVVPQYKVTDILIKRDEIRRLAQAPSWATTCQRYGIIVDDIYISDIAFVDRVPGRDREEADRPAGSRDRAADPGTEAHSGRTERCRSRGQGAVAVAAAKGEADANNAPTASISPQLIDYLRWTRWDGRLPLFSGGSAAADHRAARFDAAGTVTADADRRAPACRSRPLQPQADGSQPRAVQPTATADALTGSARGVSCVAGAPLLLEQQERGELAIVGQGLPAGGAHDAQRFRRGVALRDQHGAGHQRAAANAVLAV